MTKTEMEQYKDKKPIGVYPMSNWGGVEILDVLHGIDDYAVWRYNFGEPEEKIHKTKIRYGVNRAYIITDSGQIRLDECMRV